MTTTQPSPEQLANAFRLPPRPAAATVPPVTAACPRWCTDHAVFGDEEDSFVHQMATLAEESGPVVTVEQYPDGETGAYVNLNVSGGSVEFEVDDAEAIGRALIAAAHDEYPDKVAGTVGRVHKSKNLLTPDDGGSAVVVELWDDDRDLQVTDNLADWQDDPEAVADIGRAYVEASRLMTETRAAYPELLPPGTIEEWQHGGVRNAGAS